ncbi:MAG: acyl-CoA thioesterase [Planctomycetota bacterium]
MSVSFSPQSPRESFCMSTYLVLPAYTNIYGNIFGGKLLEWIDISGAISAYRHCQANVVTASMDDICFLHPIKAGFVVVIESQVSFVGTTSMEIKCTVYSENTKNRERQQSTVAYLTFVALNDAGKPVPVPPLALETEDEKTEFELGRERRRLRLARFRKQKK